MTDPATEEKPTDTGILSTTGLATALPAPDGYKTLLPVTVRLPHSVGWNGRRDRPWGLGDEYKPRGYRPVSELETVVQGKNTWFFRANGKRTYDTLREAFVSERLNHAEQSCGCISAYGFGEATIDCDAQLEFMRKVMGQVLREMPKLNVEKLCADLFAGQRHLCEHYLSWLENEAFVAHPEGEERQDRLLLTDEGYAALAMLEMTRDGSNIDLSPKAVHFMRLREGSLADADNPIFLARAQSREVDATKNR